MLAHLKNRYGNNSQNIVSKTNQHWVINYDKPPIHFGTDILKIVAISVFLTPHIFSNGPHFVALTQLRATKTGSKKCLIFFIFFGMLSAQGFSGCLPQKNFPLEIFGYGA